MARRIVLLLLVGAAVLVGGSARASASRPAPETVSVAFVRHGHLVRVERVVPPGVAPEVAAMRELVQGPTIALESGTDGTIRRCHASDPSWRNWPVLEHAVIGNIVPDFPLINKSFNLSYSGQDL